ncbi:hypothetical protein ACQR1Y_30685 [Bradyrhizobium sp. HKCCYLRH3099]|uniref:hypothetical protein n=1 Tax=unclassified Bradyrhizobium TaxID=2631580 RepID=UPI003EB70C3F
MASWLPMYAFPSLRVTRPVEIAHLALAYADDARVKALAESHPNFKGLLNQFTTEFGAQIEPSILMWNTDGPETYRNTEALSAFRDALALSVIPQYQAKILARESQFKMRFSNWFNIYPWMLDKNYEYVVMRSAAIFGLHEPKLLKGQTYPGLNQEIIDPAAIDQTLHKELMVRFKRRFTAEKPEWSDVALFRSLNTANAAAQLPSHGDFTPYDSGRSISLWVSAFEILAHPEEGQSGLLQVYDLLEKADWHSVACREARHPCMAPVHARRPRVLGCAIYSRMNTARNDYLHGNKISDVQLVIMPSKRFLVDYAPVLYRMALAAFLDLRFKEAEPREPAAQQLWAGRKFDFYKYQTYAEAALSTFDRTVEQQRELMGIRGKLALF